MSNHVLYIHDFPCVACACASVRGRLGTYNVAILPRMCRLASYHGNCTVCGHYYIIESCIGLVETCGVYFLLWLQIRSLHEDYSTSGFIESQIIWCAPIGGCSEIVYVSILYIT